MKRFYKLAEAGTAPGGYAVRLDGKAIRTPLLKPLILSSEGLAQEIAKEWAAQAQEIVPDTMPMMQYASTMIDKVDGHERGGIIEDLMRYAGSDLICYFATHPAGLVARQEKHWKSLLMWLQQDKDIALQSVAGIQYHHQSPNELKKIRRILDSLSAPELTIVSLVTGATGSAVVALALLARHISAEDAYHAASVDELYQQEQWGIDELAQNKLDRLKRDLSDVARFRDYLL